jgi:hypothetical protein
MAAAFKKAACASDGTCFEAEQAADASAEKAFEAISGQATPECI